MNLGNNEPSYVSPFADVDLDTDDYTVKLDAVYKEASDLGIDLSTVKHQTAIASRKAQARDLVISNLPNQQPKWFKVLKSAIVTVGNSVLLLLMTALVYVAPPAAIVALAVAEIQRVALGMHTIDPARQWYYSIAAVLGYLTLLVIKANRNQTYATQQLKPSFSFRLLWRRILYIFGIGQEWKARGISWSQILDKAISTVGWLIVFFGTFGVLFGKLVLFEGTWYNAVISIFTDSNLVTFLAIVGGGIFTAGMLSALHFLVEFSYNRYTALVPEVSTDDNFFDGTQDIQIAEKQAQLLYIKSVIAKYKTTHQL